MARSSPTDKHTLVRELRQLGEVVAVTGDGTNDAPALHEADIGMAMGISGTEVAKESADVVILDDNFSTIVLVAKWGRSVYANIQKFVQFQLTVNLVALIINFSSACITGTAPLTAVQLLWVNLIMDTLGALALATEPPHDELMMRPPVGRYGSFISNVMWRNIFGQVIYQLTVLSVLQYRGKEILHLEGDGSTELLNTMIFNAFVFCQVFNEVNAREMDKLNVFRHTFDNWVFILIITFTVVFQVLMVQVLGKFAGTVPLNQEQWLITVAIGFFSLFVAVIVKFIPTPEEPVFSRRNSNYIDVNGYQVLPSEPPLDP
jgi:Ca2+-transporting ATPase